MPGEFRQTSTALRADQERGRRSLVFFVVTGLLLLVVALWATLARVPMYAVSESARVQAKEEVHPVDTLVAGRVVSVHLPVGGLVKKGDILLALDDTDVALRLDEARAAQHGLVAQISALEAEIAARQEAIATTTTLGRASMSEAQAARTEVVAEAELASRERERAAAMRQAGVVAEAEAERADATMAQTRAALAARNHRLSVLTSGTQRDLADRRALSEERRRELAEITAARDAAAVAVRRLEVELARHVIRAPISGVLGQVKAPQVGSVVAIGQTIAVITPQTELELVADLAPADAVGRVRAGQRARMRVAGFPWTQYGMLEATVTAVSGEVADGRIRVRLALDERSAPGIPRRHGLTGGVEIELEQVSPATVLARAAGQLFERDVPQ